MDLPENGRCSVTCLYLPSTWRRSRGLVIRSEWTSISRLRTSLLLTRSAGSMLLSVCGTEAYETLKNLVRPASLKDKSYGDLVAIMDTHLNPKSSKLKYRYELFTARRKPGESIAAFVTRLQSLSQHCAYKDDVIAEMLRDAFVFGVNDVQIQRQLFREKEEFSLQSAIDTATAIELSAKDASALHARKEPQVEPVLKVSPDKPQFNKSAKKISCYRCGGGPHLATACRFREAVCRACNNGTLRRFAAAANPTVSRPQRSLRRSLFLLMETTTYRNVHSPRQCLILSALHLLHLQTVHMSSSL